jgi:hypothetical protein
VSSYDAVRRYVELVLSQVQKDGATELVIAPTKGRTTPIRYKAGGKWFEIAPPPAHVRSGMVAELGRLAKLPAEVFPKEGVIELAVSGVPSKWKLKAATADAEWVLTPVED